MSNRVNPNELLRDVFGFDAFREGQLDVIEHLLAGRSAAAVFPTGGGKSLCYQLPALCFEGVTLVVSPLIALMKDQIDALHQRNVAAARLDSSLTFDEYRNVSDQLRRGELRLLYVAPERFNNERFRQTLAHVKVSLMAIDEAHCISEWGHNFRPDYLKLPAYAKQYNVERVLALTATATPRVMEDMCVAFDISDDAGVRTGFYRPNLTLLLSVLNEESRDHELIRLLHERKPGPTIVYVTLQRTAEEVARKLADAGFSARAYHAGMESQRRADVQDWFMHGKTGSQGEQPNSNENNAPIVVATIAFGMGIDKADIRYVYHYNLPKSLEGYSQEIGRAGRDGEPSICEMLLCHKDLTPLENFIIGDTPTLPSVRSFVADVFAMGDAFDVSQYDLSRDHDIRMLVVRTLLTYLELEGYLEGGTPFYSDYQFKPLVPSSAMLDRFEGERREFVAGVLRMAVKGQVWFKLDVDSAARAANSDRQRVVTMLDYLAEQEMMELKAAGVRLRYKRLRVPADLDALSSDLHERMTSREKTDLGRLFQVVDLAEQTTCQVATLSEYFGEPRTEPCGHCTACQRESEGDSDGGRNDEAGDEVGERADFRGRSRITVRSDGRTVDNAIDDAVWQALASLRGENSNQSKVLADTQSAARFLCGVTSPKLSRAKLTKHDLFGACENVPFAAVLAALETK